MAIVFVGKDMMVIAMLFMATILAGMTGMALEIICDFDGPYVCLALLVYPVFMFIGIVRAFGEIFCEPVGTLCT